MIVLIILLFNLTFAFVDNEQKEQIDQVVIYSDEKNNFYVVDNNCEIFLQVKPLMMNSSYVNISNNYFSSQTFYNQNAKKLKNESELEVETSFNNSFVLSTLFDITNTSSKLRYFELNFYNFHNKSKQELLGSTGLIIVPLSNGKLILNPNGTLYIKHNNTNMWSIKSFSKQWKQFADDKCNSNLKHKKVYNQYSLIQLLPNAIPSEVMYSTVINVAFVFGEKYESESSYAFFVVGGLFLLFIIFLCLCFSKVKKSNRWMDK